MCFPVLGCRVFCLVWVKVLSKLKSVSGLFSVCLPTDNDTQRYNLMYTLSTVNCRMVVFSPSIDINVTSSSKLLLTSANIKFSFKSLNSLWCNSSPYNSIQLPKTHVLCILSVFNILLESNSSIKTKENRFYTIKENSICNTFPVLKFQQLLVNEHHRLCDLKSWSQFDQVQVSILSPTKQQKNKPHADQEPFTTPWLCSKKPRVKG